VRRELDANSVGAGATRGGGGGGPGGERGEVLVGKMWWRRWDTHSRARNTRDHARRRDRPFTLGVPSVAKRLAPRSSSRSPSLRKATISVSGKKKMNDVQVFWLFSRFLSLGLRVLCTSTWF